MGVSSVPEKSQRWEAKWNHQVTSIEASSRKSHLKSQESKKPSSYKLKLVQHAKVCTGEMDYEPRRYRQDLQDKYSLVPFREFTLKKGLITVRNVENALVKRQHLLHTRGFILKKKTYKCGECGKSLSQSSNLTEHCKLHSGERPWVWRALDANPIMSGVREHTGERPYECDKCEKLFRQSFSLVEHQRIHTTMRLYACNQCKKSFSQKSALIVHQRVNTRERPNKCGERGKSFSQSSNLIEHCWIHTGEKPYECG